VPSATSKVVNPVGDFFNGVIHYGDLKTENARLRDQLQEQRSASLQAAESERELQALKDQQKLDFVGDVPTVAASVVFVTASNFDLTVQIDRGTDAGIAVGMPVVSGGGLVGRVVDVSRLRSTVMLITDPRTNVGVTLVNANETAVAAGNGLGKPLRLDFLDAKSKVAEGDKVVTSGLQGGRYPQGIPVGTVTSVRRPVGAVQPEVEVTPIADLGRLEFVKVLQWAPGA
jgi:rod shape-determining protein MreC